MAAEIVSLTVLEVAKAAKVALDEGRLAAQNPRRRPYVGNGPGCFYRDGRGFPCAVGAALDDKTARRFDRHYKLGGSTVLDLVTAGLLDVDDRLALTRLQGAHDCWQGGSGSRATFERVLSDILAGEAA